MSRTITMRCTGPQAEFHALTSKYSLFVGGLGSGKSYTMIDSAIIGASVSPKAVIALYAPTYDLVSLIIADRLCGRLDEFGIEFSYNKKDNRIYTHSPGFGDFILRTLDKPERIVGYESYQAHIDELDTLSSLKAETAWNKVVARNRQRLGIPGTNNRVYAYTTPEGFRFAYKRWVKEKNDLYERVHASSYSNPFLPDDYIDSLRATYPPKLVEAYIDGKFTNMESGSVYSSYDRKAHNSTEKIRRKETLHIGCDFNVDKTAATIFVTRQGGKEWHVVEELHDMYDTPEMIRIIKEKWSEHPIIMYPDATGANRESINASISDIALLQQAGFAIRAHKTNPRVRDRIVAFNGALSHGKVYVNHVACPEVARCLEQQAYDKNGQPDKKSGTDHQNDATSYVIAYELPIRKPVAQIDFSYAV